MDFICMVYFIELGICYLLSIVKNEIIDIFYWLGFSIVDGFEIEDDLYVFIVMNFVEDYFVCDM